MSTCAYVRQHYGVPAQVGRRVIVDGQPGVIAQDRGHHIGVNFDAAKPGVIESCHPTWRVEYLRETATVRRQSRSQARYQRYLDADTSESFIEWLRAEGFRRRLGHCNG